MERTPLTMLFSSLIFLQAFLPLTLAAYYGIGLLPASSPEKKRRRKNTILLIASLVFYGFSGLKYLLLMLAVILLNYFGGLLVSRGKTSAARKAFLAGTVILNLGLLFFFKYFNLFRDVVGQISALFGGEPGAFTRIILPVGISFYIFQALSYTIDVYRGDAELQKNPLDFALYVSCFPQLIAGPIVQYSDVSAQLTERRENAEQFSEGIRRFLYGLAKKVLIANSVAEIADGIWALEIGKIGAGLAWLGALAYFFQIYYDFSGYSDMAIGLGKMFGLDFKENFRYPYLADSVTDFWRRWHISLGSWFRNYVYIPLGGNRKGEGRAVFNMAVVFFLTGVWHGANWTFFFWGAYHGIFRIAEYCLTKNSKRNSRSRRKRFRLPGQVYTFLVVLVGWIFFRADTLPDAFAFVGQLFGTRGVDETILSFLSFRRLLALLCAFLGLGFFQEHFHFLLDKIQKITRGILERIWLLFLLFLCILLLTNSNYNPFIYFQF